MVHSFGRFSSSAKSKSQYGMAFDIDGVLVRGPKVLPRARESLKKLVDANVPFVFVTNGGGCTEHEKAQELTKLLGVEVVRSMVVLCHSPMRTLVPELSSKRVLVLGSKARIIAKEDLGLRDMVTPEEFAVEWPNLFPFTGEKYYVKRRFPERLPGEGKEPRPVSAILVLHDPLDWLLEAQVVTDVLKGGNPPGSGDGPQTPMYVSNPDLLYAAAYSEPRFGAGAFADTVSMLYAKRFGAGEPVIGEFGKPTAATFDFARNTLEGRAEAMGLAIKNGGRPLDRIYMVGDNPSGDIRGANNAGAPWISNLVRTGLFRGDGGGDNDETNPAHFVHDDVGACVDFAMRREAEVFAAE